jgi:hypothetical protein
VTIIAERPFSHPDARYFSDLRGLEDILITLATWEDADDNFVLPPPVAGQRALHAVRRLADALANGRAEPDPTDLALVREAVAALAKGLTAGEENIRYAVDLHDHAPEWLHAGFLDRQAS